MGEGRAPEGEGSVACTLTEGDAIADGGGVQLIEGVRRFEIEAEFRLRLDIVRSMLDLGVNEAVPNPQGLTPLAWMAQKEP